MSTALINIGNTNTELCGLDLSGKRRVPTREFILGAEDFLSFYDTCFIASVVPEVTGSLLRSCSHLQFHQLSVENISSIDFTNVVSSTIGADRLANLLAAQSFYGSNVLVLDCGTCVTAELLIEDCFLGGFIMPGRQVQRLSLSRHTGQLPQVPISADMIDLGSNTVDSIKVGIDTLSVLGVQTWINKQVRKYPDLKVCYTGGDCDFYSEKATFDFTITQDLTLAGLKAFAELSQASK